MKQWFLDTNVVVDVLLNREPFALDSAAVLELAQRKQVQLYATSLTFGTTYYLVRKTRSHEQTVAILTQLAQLVQILAVDAAAVQQSLAANFPDFEDALQYFAATAVPAIEAIITRDPKGFQHSLLPVLTPTEALRQLT